MLLRSEGAVNPVDDAPLAVEYMTDVTSLPDSGFEELPVWQVNSAAEV